MLFNVGEMTAECKLLRASCNLVRANGRGQTSKQRSNAENDGSGGREANTLSEKPISREKRKQQSGVCLRSSRASNGHGRQL